MKQYPFETDLEELLAHLDDYVSVVFASLESDFLVMPKGQGFIEYATFEAGYEALKQATNGFAKFHPDMVLSALQQQPMIFIVRCAPRQDQKTFISRKAFLPGQAVATSEGRSPKEVATAFARRPPGHPVGARTRP